MRKARGATKLPWAQSGRQRHARGAARPRAPCAPHAPPASPWPPRRSPARRRSRAVAGSPIAQLRHGARQHLLELRARCPPARTARAAPSSAGPRSGRPEISTSRTTCSGSAEESTIIAFCPPVSAISGTIGPSRAASALVDAARRVGRAGEGDAGDARIGDQRRADTRPVARQQMQHVAPARRPHAAAHGRAPRSAASARPAWRCTALPAASAAATWPVKIASGKFQGEMQANTPRPCSAIWLRSPVGPGSGSGCGEIGARPLRRSSGRNRPPRAPRPAHRGWSCRPRARRAPSARARFCSIRSAARSRQAGALGRRRAVPVGGRAQRARCSAASTSSVPASITWPTMRRRSAGLVIGLRRAARAPRPPISGAAVQRSDAAAPSPARSGASSLRSVRSMPRGIAPPAPNRSAGSGMRGCGLIDMLAHARHRIGDQLVDRRRLVDDAVDERGVGAVLQQPPHQIGQQILVAADRRIDARGACPACPAPTTSLVERLAHAVQALELEVAAVARHLQHGRERVGVVGRELRIEGARGSASSLLRAGEIGDIGRGLAREHGIARQAALLAPLDLAVPIGALDQPHHQPPLVPRAPCRRSQSISGRQRF